MKNNIKTQLIRYTIPCLLGIGSYILTGLAKSVFSKLPKEYQASIVADPRTWIVAFLLLVILILASWIHILSKDKRLTVKNGIYWDDQNNPYCPSCKIPIQFKWYEEERGESTYTCLTCGTGFCDGKHTDKNRGNLI